MPQSFVEKVPSALINIESLVRRWKMQKILFRKIHVPPVITMMELKPNAEAYKFFL